MSTLVSSGLDCFGLPSAIMLWVFIFGKPCNEGDPVTTAASPH
jgi:hypothetical protein